jgi:hypothetical protein
MAIVSFDTESVIDYLPEYGGNRDTIDPCVIRLKFVPFSRLQQYSRLLAARTKGVTDSARVSEVSQSIQKKQFTDNVESVSGYFVESREVTDPEGFYETADTELVLEVISAMESHAKLSEGQRKN